MKVHDRSNTSFDSSLVNIADYNVACSLDHLAAERKKNKNVLYIFKNICESRFQQLQKRVALPNMCIKGQYIKLEPGETNCITTLKHRVRLSVGWVHIDFYPQFQAVCSLIGCYQAPGRSKSVFFSDLTSFDQI